MKKVFLVYFFVMVIKIMLLKYDIKVGFRG